jgi:hypothetical protein
MKKLIVLLLMGLAMTGMIAAAVPAHPPGTPALEIALPGYGVHEAAVTPGTVLAPAPPLWALPAGVLAVSGYDMPPERPKPYHPIQPVDTALGAIALHREPPDYWIRI